MFAITEADIEAICAEFDRSGELAAVVELLTAASPACPTTRGRESAHG